MKTGARFFWRGHACTWDGKAWNFDDTGKPLPGYGGEFRPCAKCGALMNDHEPDRCLGQLPGVDNACCGHGRREESYVRFKNGVVLLGFVIGAGEIPGEVGG